MLRFFKSLPLSPFAPSTFRPCGMVTTGLRRCLRSSLRATAAVLFGSTPYALRSPRIAVRGGSFFSGSAPFRRLSGGSGPSRGETVPSVPVLPRDASAPTAKRTSGLCATPARSVSPRTLRRASVALADSIRARQAKTSSTSKQGRRSSSTSEAAGPSAAAEKDVRSRKDARAALRKRSTAEKTRKGVRENAAVGSQRQKRAAAKLGKATGESTGDVAAKKRAALAAEAPLGLGRLGQSFAIRRRPAALQYTGSNKHQRGQRSARPEHSAIVEQRRWRAPAREAQGIYRASQELAPGRVAYFRAETRTHFSPKRSSSLRKELNGSRGSSAVRKRASPRVKPDAASLTAMSFRFSDSPQPQGTPQRTRRNLPTAASGGVSGARGIFGARASNTADGALAFVSRRYDVAGVPRVRARRRRSAGLTPMKEEVLATLEQSRGEEARTPLRARAGLAALALRRLRVRPTLAVLRRALALRASLGRRALPFSAKLKRSAKPAPERGHTALERQSPQGAQLSQDIALRRGHAKAPRHRQTTAVESRDIREARERARHETKRMRAVIRGKVEHRKDNGRRLDYGSAGLRWIAPVGWKKRRATIRRSATLSTVHSAARAIASLRRSSKASQLSARGWLEQFLSRSNFLYRHYHFQRSEWNGPKPERPLRRWSFAHRRWESPEAFTGGGQCAGFLRRVALQRAPRAPRAPRLLRAPRRRRAPRVQRDQRDQLDQRDRRTPEAPGRGRKARLLRRFPAMLIRALRRLPAIRTRALRFITTWAQRSPHIFADGGRNTIRLRSPKALRRLQSHLRALSRRSLRRRFGRQTAAFQKGPYRGSLIHRRTRGEWVWRFGNRRNSNRRGTRRISAWQSTRRNPKRCARRSAYRAVRQHYRGGVLQGTAMRWKAQRVEQGANQSPSRPLLFLRTLRRLCGATPEAKRPETRPLLPFAVNVPSGGNGLASPRAAAHSPMLRRAVTENGVFGHNALRAALFAQELKKMTPAVIGTAAPSKKVTDAERQERTLSRRVQSRLALLSWEEAAERSGSVSTTRSSQLSTGNFGENDQADFAEDGGLFTVTGMESTAAVLPLLLTSARAWPAAVRPQRTQPFQLSPAERRCNVPLPVRALERNALEATAPERAVQRLRRTRRTFPLEKEDVTLLVEEAKTVGAETAAEALTTKGGSGATPSATPPATPPATPSATPSAAPATAPVTTSPFAEVTSPSVGAWVKSSDMLGDTTVGATAEGASTHRKTVSNFGRGASEEEKRDFALEVRRYRRREEATVSARTVSAWPKGEELRRLLLAGRFATGALRTAVAATAAVYALVRETTKAAPGEHPASALEPVGAKRFGLTVGAAGQRAAAALSMLPTVAWSDALRESFALPTRWNAEMAEPTTLWREQGDYSFLERGSPLRWSGPLGLTVSRARSGGRLEAMLRRRRLLERLSRRALLVVLTPRRNNAYCTVHPYRFRGEPGEVIFGSSAGRLSKFKGMARRSADNRRRLYELAAFRLLRFAKQRTPYRYLIVRLRHFAETLPSRGGSPERTRNLLRSLLRPLFSTQLQYRFRLLWLQTDNGIAYAPRGYRRRRRKHKAPPKKRRF